jgi:hypothetical protein
VLQPAERRVLEDGVVGVAGRGGLAVVAVERVVEPGDGVGRRQRRETSG